MSDLARCSARSLARGEALAGTATTYSAWILLEQPGPWGHTALTDSRLPGDLGLHLQELSAQLGIRVGLIRRHDGGAVSDSSRRCFVASTTPGRLVLESARLGSPADVLDFDLAALTRGETVGLEPVTEPHFFVCTHGKHDACCAERGRPVAAALDAYAPGRTWECSHLGGDRFAGNLLCLPDGLYYGRLTPERALEVARAYDDGRMDLESVRGRCAYPSPVQAAEIFLRRSTGNDALDALRLIDVRRETGDGTDEVSARFLLGDAPYTVRIARDAHAPAQLSCGAEEMKASDNYRLVGVTQA